MINDASRLVSNQSGSGVGFRRSLVIWSIPSLLLLSGCANELPREQPISSDAELAAIQTSSGGEMTLVTGGQFTMGDSGGAADETPHDVRVDSFYMDRFPISQEIYERVTGKNPSKRKSAKNPVERIQWIDAARFCNTCSEIEALAPCYDLETWSCDFEADGYRLPTEAEWEYASRAGSQSRYFFGDDEAMLPKYAWFKPYSKGRPHAVGKKLPNRWGLHDMLGNVWEWCNDYYDEAYYAAGPRDNPTGPANGKKRVLRGGAWSLPAEMCRVSVRFSEFQVFTDACFGSDSYGFRRVRRVARDGESSVGPGVAEAVRAASVPRNDAPLTTATDNEKTEAGAEVASKPVTDAHAEVASGPLDKREMAKIDPKRLTGTIVFVSDRAGSLDIWSMAASGQSLKQLTDDSHADADPRFSPSGKRIMYTTLRDGFPQIWTMDVAGSDPQHVTDGSQADWSPDGRSIVFIRDDQAFVRNLDTGNEKRATPEEWRRCGVPTWSPEGNQLAVASRHLERIGIFLFNLDGTGYRQLETEDACCTPQWSGDGSRIVFQTDKGHIHLHYADDGSEEQVTFGADVQHDARFSPDSSMIVYCRAPSEEGPWQLWITDLEGDDLEAIQITNEGSNQLPDWHKSTQLSN
ncbi:MAG: SUMF1/EgtB/PvdO family nonheme iron enzyme [Pirellulaceae bacterium]|jgi:formylglycine-generating enzyme required for sulfatase activity|nr:SUMF1/EgtB/PvdO family nonheme iron enzyme [Pirellulaceae bacterium]